MAEAPSVSVCELQQWCASRSTPLDLALLQRRGPGTESLGGTGHQPECSGSETGAALECDHEQVVGREALILPA